MGSTCPGPGLGAQNPAALVPALLGGRRAWSRAAAPAGRKEERPARTPGLVWAFTSSIPTRPAALRPPEFILASGPLLLLFPRPGAGSPQTTSGLFSPSAVASSARPSLPALCGTLMSPPRSRLPSPGLCQSPRNTSHRGHSSFP